MIFGCHEIPFRFEEKKISVGIEKHADSFVYRREADGASVEKILLSHGGKILINPIEPVNTPKEITRHLLIEMNQEIISEPKSVTKVYLLFPVEIGIFISANREEKATKDFRIIDLFSLSRKKYILYGEITSGILCKHWSSDVYTSIPESNPLFEGVMELSVVNKTQQWIPVTKAVFDAYQMKIFYSENAVSMNATMDLLGENIAETVLDNIPLNEGMEKSLEVYVSRKLPVITSRFVMEWGL